MARCFGSRDSFKRNSANYKGRLLGAKDLVRRDGFKVWLCHQDKKFFGFSKELIPEHAELWWRGRYLYEVLRIMRPSRRYRFKALNPTMETLYSSMLADIEDKINGLQGQVWKAKCHELE